MPPRFQILGSLRCHYGDGSENLTKQLVKISKTTTLHVHQAFLYISLPSLHDYEENCLISRFIDNVNIRRRISLALFKLFFFKLFLKNSTPGELAYIKHSDRDKVIVLKFHRPRSHFLSDVFCRRRRRGILNSLFSSPVLPHWQVVKVSPKTQIQRFGLSIPPVGMV